MPLLAATPTPSAPDKAARVARQVAQLKGLPAQAKNALVQTYKQGHRLLWGMQGTGENVITPADRIALLNETKEGGELIATANGLIAFLNQMLAGQDDALLAELNALHASIPAHTITATGIVKLT